MVYNEIFHLTSHITEKKMSKIKFLLKQTYCDDIMLTVSLPTFADCMYIAFTLFVFISSVM